MSGRNRTPPTLQPYLEDLPPELTLTILTGTLSCGSSWLTTRFIASALQHDNTAVVLVSWMNDEAFWRTQLKRIASIDLEKSRLAFVDRLAESLHNPRSAAAELEDINKKTADALQKCQGSKALLVLDGIDSLLAIQPEIDALQLSNLLLKLRAHFKTHATVITCMADIPRSTEQRLTPIELNDTAFVTQQAHIARSIVSVRKLETGFARDVSGIIRITNGGDGATVQELEKRYLVQRDGSVKIVE